MLEIFKLASTDPIKFLSCILLAAIPVVIWMKIFLRKHPQKRIHVIITFIFGMLSAALVLGYQALWGAGPTNLVFFQFEAMDFRENIQGMVASSVLASFWIYMSVGLIEEVSKHFVVVKADRKIFESVDDVIELSIVSALGFAFLENIGYFFAVIVNGNTENLFMLFLIRSLFVVFIHMLCSGIYGYFYGIGHFAKPYMQMEIQKGRKFYIANFLHKVLHFRKTDVFRERMAMEGLFLAVFIHGIYDFIMEMNFYIFGKPAFIIILPLYLIIGFWYLSHLLEKKENLKHFGHLVEKEVFVKTESEEELRQRINGSQRVLFRGKQEVTAEDIMKAKVQRAV